MTDFFTSDTHFGHKNIISYCNRPWANVEEMTVGLAKRWNAKVGPQDTVYHLGDFAMGHKELWAGYRRLLNGRICLIVGNHDAPEDRIRAALLPGDMIHNEYLYLTNAGYLIHLAHVPGYYDDGRGYVRSERALLDGGIEPHYRFCGHVHDAWAVDRHGTINVGVDVRDYEPKTLEELGIR